VAAVSLSADEYLADVDAGAFAAQVYELLSDPSIQKQVLKFMGDHRSRRFYQV
jgi:hypothetical protein